ncbi:MAG: winged helix-turn-helix domain-containing protein [Gemmatimonadetes bacterium]|nr:winged helix-turn-helix domain-containing protein [Gemmatimonadota bacterium]
MSRAELMEHVWEDKSNTYSNIIDVYASRLRRKIEEGDDAARGDAARDRLHAQRAAGAPERARGRRRGARGRRAHARVSMRWWPSSLRARLTLWFTIVLGVPLVAFAIVSYVVFDRTPRPAPTTSSRTPCRRLPASWPTSGLWRHPLKWRRAPRCTRCVSRNSRW